MGSAGACSTGFRTAHSISFIRLPSFVLVADELALEFDQWREVVADNGAPWTRDQQNAIAALDELLAEMSGPGKPELWLEKGCLDHPKWTEVRRLAKVVLDVFGWPEGIPPLKRATYVSSEGYQEQE